MSKPRAMGQQRILVSRIFLSALDSPELVQPLPRVANTAFRYRADDPGVPLTDPLDKGGGGGKLQSKSLSCPIFPAFFFCDAQTGEDCLALPSLSCVSQGGSGIDELDMVRVKKVFVPTCENSCGGNDGELGSMSRCGRRDSSCVFGGKGRGELDSACVVTVLCGELGCSDGGSAKESLDSVSACTIPPFCGRTKL